MTPSISQQRGASGGMFRRRTVVALIVLLMCGAWTLLCDFSQANSQLPNSQLPNSQLPAVRVASLALAHNSQLPAVRVASHALAHNSQLPAVRVASLALANGRCGPAAGRAPNGQTYGCEPDSDFPCCSGGGWCGLTQQHCKCSNCKDYRTVVHCPATAGAPSDGIWPLAELCPQCEPGQRFIASSSGSDNKRDNDFNPCSLPIGTAVKTIADLKEVYRLDLYSLGTSPKLNFVYASGTFRNTGNFRTTFVYEKLGKWPAPLIRPRSVAIDIGANVGDTTVPMAVVAAHTIAFEAVPGVFQVLQAQSRLNPHLRLDVHNLAAYERDTTLTFSGGGGNFGMTSGGNIEVKAVEPVRFLKDTYGAGMLHNISFIKIDTEGYDSGLLKVLGPWLRSLPMSSKPLIQVEWFDQFRHCSNGQTVTEGSNKLFDAISEIGYTPYELPRGFKLSSVVAQRTCAKSVPDLLLKPAGAPETQGTDWPPFSPL